MKNLRKETMKKINGIIINGIAYKATEEQAKGSCLGCDFFPERPNCAISRFCMKLHCIFRYSPVLTDKINEI